MRNEVPKYRTHRTKIGFGIKTLRIYFGRSNSQNVRLERWHGCPDDQRKFTKNMRKQTCTSTPPREWNILMITSAEIILLDPIIHYTLTCQTHCSVSYCLVMQSYYFLFVLGDLFMCDNNEWLLSHSHIYRFGWNEMHGNETTWNFKSMSELTHDDKHLCIYLLMCGIMRIQKRYKTNWKAYRNEFTATIND